MFVKLTTPLPNHGNCSEMLKFLIAKASEFGIQGIESIAEAKTSGALNSTPRMNPTVRLLVRNEAPSPRTTWRPRPANSQSNSRRSAQVHVAKARPPTTSGTERCRRKNRATRCRLPRPQELAEDHIQITGRNSSARVHPSPAAAHRPDAHRDGGDKDQVNIRQIDVELIKFARLALKKSCGQNAAKVHSSTNTNEHVTRRVAEIALQVPHEDGGDYVCFIGPNLEVMVRVPSSK